MPTHAPAVVARPTREHRVHAGAAPPGVVRVRPARVAVCAEPLAADGGLLGAAHAQGDDVVQIMEQNDDKHRPLDGDVPKEDGGVDDDVVERELAEPGLPAARDGRCQNDEHEAAGEER